MPVSVSGLKLSMETLAKRFFSLISIVLSGNPFSQKSLLMVNDFTHKLGSIITADQKTLMRPVSL